MVAWFDNLRNRGVAIRLIVLGLITFAAYALAVPVAIHLGGSTALAAATVAGGLCLAGAAAALVVADRTRGSGGAFRALWLGMTLRMGVPLTAGIAIHLHGGPLARAGLLCYLLVFYLTALVAGTILALPPRSR
jgi:hypothetical protein